MVQDRHDSDRRQATLTVAASDSVSTRNADYVCSGADDQVTIQAALDAAAGGKVILLEGNYQITANLVIPAATHFSGIGKGTILTTTDAIGITNMVSVGGDNVTISDMKLVLGAGAGDDGSRPNIIHGTSHDYVWLERLWLVGDASVADDGSDVRQNGICLVTVSLYSKVLSCHIETNKRHGLYLNGFQQGVVASCSSVDNTQNGLHLNTSPNNAISNNVFHDNSGCGIYMEGSGNNAVTGNNCNNNTQHGIHVFASNINAITGNQCLENDAAGNTYSGILVEESGRTIVVGNACYYNGLHGIYILNSVYGIVTGNDCEYSATGDGINVTGEALGTSDCNSITSNVCVANTSNGIAIVGGAKVNFTSIKANTTLTNDVRGIVDAGTNTIFDQVMHSIVLDLTAGATDIEVFFAGVPCILAGYTVLYSVATGGGAGVNIRVGRYQDGVVLDDDYFAVSVSEINKAKGYSKHFVSADLTQTVIAAGDTITVGTAGAKADTGEVIVILKIAEMSD